LLDVNALLALGLISHEFHDRVATWLLQLASSKVSEVATCSITELGFVRVVSQVRTYGYTLAEARTLLARVKSRSIVKFSFIADDQDLSALPHWVNFPKQLTDGHLLQLAKASGAGLATLDRGIPGALVIPG
jgi:predicted nucleic acid-binding protein